MDKEGEEQQAPPPKTRKKGKKKKGLFSFLKKKDSESKESSQPAKTTAFDQKSDKSDQKEKEKKGFLESIFGKKKSDQEIETAKYQRKVFKELQSIRFIYQPVKGIQAKVRQLVPFKGRILAGTNQGIFELIDTSAVLISAGPIRYIYASENLDLVLVSTMDEQLKTFKLEDEIWTEVDVFPYFTDLIQHINEDASKNIWLAGSDSVYRITLFDNDSLTFQGYHLRNDFFDQVFILNHDKRVCFVNSTGYYYYDAASDILMVDSLLLQEHGNPNNYLFNPPDFLWVYDGKVWDMIGRSPSQNILDYLKLFNNISYLFYQDGSNDLWVVTSDNHLYKYDISSPTKYLTNHHLFLKEIRNKTGNTLPLRNLQIQQENSYIIFEFTQPDYLGLQELEYQYRLKGLNNEWSAWSPNNVISFHYLPPGTYSLKVRTKNSFGQVQESSPYNFKVIPPIWRRWWFYLGEIIFFGALLVLSFRLNRMKSRNRVLSRLLTFMTLILLLEFIETIVESNLALKNSPIIDFFIEASIALLILPIERLLRGYLFKQEEKTAKA